MEGRASVQQAKVKERSRKLREAALAHYTVDGTITCSACGFDFSKFYGRHGDGYIQMHHEKPIYQYSDEGFSTYISKAVQDMKPLCANCHCMIHRRRSSSITIEALKQIIADAKTSQV